MTGYDFNVSHSNPKDQKQIYEFGKEMNFNIRQKGGNSGTDKSLLKLPKSPAIMASRISAIFLSSKVDELCNRLKLLLQEEKAGNNSAITNDEIVVILDKLIE